MMRAIFVIPLFLVLAANALAQSERDEREPDPLWRASALALVPQGYMAGDAYRTDGALGYLAVYPASANDPKSPLSVFTPREVLVVGLVDGKAISASPQPRTDPTRGHRSTSLNDPDGNEREHTATQDKLAAGRASLPAGTEPCDLHAWSADRDPKVLNVRAEPSVKARVLGTLPPPYRFKGGASENTPPGGWLTEFHIIGYRDGWFLIEGAQPPGLYYEDKSKYPRNAPKPYAGRGWIASNKVGATFANGGTRAGGLFQAPHADAHWVPAKNQQGEPLNGEFGPKRIFACSGIWALVESHDAVRGWWRYLCSSQVTNCS